MSVCKKIASIAAAGTLLFSGMCFSANTTVSDGALGNGDITFHWSTEEGFLNKTVAANTTETYRESDRKWLGLPTVTLTAGGRLWCAFQTGDSIEGSAGANNYNVLYWSDDGGKTWSDAFAVFDVADENIRLTDPRLFEDQDGTLWLVLIRGGLNGVYAIEVKNPDCANPVDELSLGTPIKWMDYPPAHRPTVLTQEGNANGLWVTPVEVSMENQETYVCKPNKQANTYTWTKITVNDGRATTSMPGHKTYGESQIVELKDGRLMMLSRLNKGYGNGLEVSYSSDLGMNWTAYRSGLDYPFAGPSSKFHIQRLESGNLLLINHESLTARTNLTAYLSTDDGKTFPYKLLLDDRTVDGKWGVSYPEASARQGENGEIYITYDGGRYDRKEIRLAVITEKDIMAGIPVSASCVLRSPVVQSGGYRDLVSVSESYERYRYVEVGTEKTEILSTLPATVTATDQNGTAVTLTGEWITENYNGNEAGRYSFRFETVLPEKTDDARGLLTVYVCVGEEDPRLQEPSDPAETPGGSTDGTEDPPGGDPVPDNGCGSVAGIGGGAVIVTAATVLGLRRKHKKISYRKDSEGGNYET